MNVQANSITPKTFINSVFPRDILRPDEAPVIAHPDSFIKDGARKNYYRQYHYNPRMLLPYGRDATYFCVSTAQRQMRRQVRKRLEDVRTAMVLVCDDIGTKAELPCVPPSYMLETSLGNFQAGYLLEPYDVSTPHGQAYFDSVLYSLAQAGFNDPGCRSASRLVRLPGSLHKTGFVARIHPQLWHPHRAWDLEDLADAFDIPLVEPAKRQALAPGKYAHLRDVDDDIYAWLIENVEVYGHNDQWVYVECPWREEHTDGAQGPSSTAYSPMDYGREGRGFKCMHGHCAHRTTHDFVDWANAQRNAEHLAMLQAKIDLDTKDLT